MSTLVAEPIQAPRRHRIYFKVEAVLFRFLLRFNPKQSRYVCPACLRLDHEHCEGANGRWTFCLCDDPDEYAHLHLHPHDPSRLWPYPEATASMEHGGLDDTLDFLSELERQEAAKELRMVNSDQLGLFSSEAVE